MKNNLIVKGISVIVLMFGMIVAGCKTSSKDAVVKFEPTKFEGTWVYAYQTNTHTYIFNGNTMQYKNSSGAKKSGTFTFTETDITFIPAEGAGWRGWTQGYTLDGVTLILKSNDASQPFGSFTKQ